MVVEVGTYIVYRAGRTRGVRRENVLYYMP